MTKTKIETLWHEAIRQVGLKPLEEDGYRLIRMAPDSRFGIYAGIDSSCFPLLAIGVQARPQNVVTESSSLDYFRQQRRDGSWLMVLRLRQNGLESVFGRLCQDLVDAAEGMPNENALVGLFKDRMWLWKKLFQHGGSGFLQPHEIKGLIAELLVLESLLRSDNGNAHETVVGWTGPLGSDQDFMYSDRAIEVKAIEPGAESVIISSLEQLDCSVQLNLVLATLRQASPGEGGAVGLNDLTATIEGLIAYSPEALAVFKDRLLESRYVEHDFYETVLFESVSLFSYRVEDAFPKLLRDMTPTGIIKASYALDINFIANFLDD